MIHYMAGQLRPQFNIENGTEFPEMAHITMKSVLQNFQKIFFCAEFSSLETAEFCTKKTRFVIWCMKVPITGLGCRATSKPCNGDFHAPDYKMCFLLVFNMNNFKCFMHAQSCLLVVSNNAVMH